VSETAILYGWTPQVVLWEMDVTALKWWWENGWRTWAKQHGISMDDEKPAEDLDTVDHDAIRARYGTKIVRG